MPLLISDSNVLIDLVDGGLIERLFLLQDDIATPAALFIEELEETYPHLPALGLILVDYEGADWLESIQDFKTKYRGPSDMDLLALLIARQRQCPLVTGDKKLRRAADQEKVPVQGTLSLMQAMMEAALITVDEAEIAYGRMRQAGSHLPWPKVKEQLEQARNSLQSEE
jgi:predicted nucleic acid-binding protein